MRNLKKFGIAFLAMLLWIGSIPAYGAAVEVSAEAAIVMDAESGEVICELDAYSPRPPASLTKVMTAVLALEKADLDDVCVVSKEAAATGESHIGFAAGEKITVENLLYGALLKSGNDACVVMAENIGDDEEQFVAMMNLKAKLLGCKDTHFTNTNGLPDEEHYSTCYDLALISRYALQNETFAEIVGTQSYTMEWVSGRKKTISTTNRMLSTYDGAIGVKTGTTNVAGQCLIAAAERDGKCYIAVVLKSQNRFLDCTKLLDYAFSLED